MAMGSALRHHIGDKSIYFAAFLLGTLVGTFDEILQWIVSGGVAPFLHEIRVHIFRRDKRLKRALSSDDEAVQSENFLIAYKENLILEKYFGQTLERSPYMWDESIKAQVLAPINPKTPHESPVSAGVWASVNERMTWIIIGVILLVLLIINLYFARISKHKTKRNLT